jgi:predicted small lipoprotein YifL
MSRRRQLWLLALLTAATTGCGLKGPLTLPSRSDEIVIRGPGETTTEPVPAPATTPAATPARPQEERPPPPPLPGSGSGAASGG